MQGMAIFICPKSQIKKQGCFELYFNFLRIKPLQKTVYGQNLLYIGSK